MLLANKGFVSDAHSAASGKGMPGIRVVGTTVPCESTVRADIDAGVVGAMQEIIEGLTRPLAAEEKSPKPITSKPPRIAFKGNYEEVNRYFYGKGWTDGLPIVPPTEKAVAEMLAGTDLPPDHVVAKIIPRLGQATVEKIAINAVMAGALPTYMPVLIAAVQAVSDPKTRFDTFEVSTGSWAPFLAINGPVRNDININCSSGALSPGNIANAAIGRALGLIIKNIGGARKAIEDMGVIGNPGKYSLVIGEYEEESPWEPLSVERGFIKGDSTLTVFFPNTFIQTIPGETNAKGILTALAGMGAGGMSALIVIPSWAKVLSGEGYTKQKVKEYIAENYTSPFAALPGTRKTARPKMDIDNLMILVAGGPGSFMALLRSVGGFENALVTKKIELPKNWHKLVAKYRDIIPNHEKY
ncbi:MAG: hypothetical protein JXA73_07870 [Acidobacteria bacterium]|nr:hypothetical protein [Acidobacteriota bacterium]